MSICYCFNLNVILAIWKKQKLYINDEKSFLYFNHSWSDSQVVSEPNMNIDFNKVIVTNNLDVLLLKIENCTLENRYMASLFVFCLKSRSMLFL